MEFSTATASTLVLLLSIWNEFNYVYGMCAAST